MHLVWATHKREPLLTASVEPRIHGCISGEARRLGCTVLTIGGVADHVHLLITLPSAVSVAQVARQAKGVSSKLGGELAGALSFFRWQEGYSAFSISRSHVSRVTAYVERQKEHHATGRLWADWEPEDE